MAAMTQSELAGFSKVSVRAIRDLESGRANRPRRETVRLLADGLGLIGQQRAEFEASGARGAVGSLWTGVAVENDYDAPPALMSPIVGRAVESRTVWETLAHGRHRLVNIVGVGGVGKTALAAHWARAAYEQGTFPVWWRALADTVAPGRWRVDLAALVELVGGNRVAVVFDGADGDFPGDELATALRRCSRLSVIVTSREPVIPAEGRLLPLGPLATTAADGEPSDALRVLVENIQRTDPAFEVDEGNRAALRSICELLDGHPLALRQAAAWCSSRSPHDLVENLSADIGVLGQAGGQRVGQSNAVEAFTACLNALEPRERILLDRLAKLAGELSPERSAGPTGSTVDELAALFGKLSQRGIMRRRRREKGVGFALLNPVRLLLRQRADVCEQAVVNCRSTALLGAG